jgi:hypothetical protein
VLLVGSGFLLGRLTAPAPDAYVGPVAVPSPKPTGAASGKAASMANTAAPVPAEKTAPAPTAAEVASSTPGEAVDPSPAPQNPPGAALSAVAQTSALEVPRRSGGPIRAAASARPERIESPPVARPATSPEPLNPFVQAVQDSIKEDLAAHVRQ